MKHGPEVVDGTQLSSDVRVSMTASSDWIRMEDSIARLLPSEGAVPDRTLLLAELSDYARAVAHEARRLGQIAPTAEERAQDCCWLDRPVFVCGHHRSGTTLLQQLLDGHPELLVLPSEGTYLTSFAYAARTDPTPTDIDRFSAEWIARFIDPNHEPHFKLGRSGPHGNPSVLFARCLLGWHAALLQVRPVLARFALFLALPAAYRHVVSPSSTPRSWVEKTPLNERNVRSFAAFSQARFLQLVREPGATLASLREIYRSSGTRDFDLAAHARTVRQSLQLAQKYRQQSADRYLMVRYEDLTDDPTQEMTRVRTFLGIRPHPSLSTPTVGGYAVRSNSSFKQTDVGIVQRSHHPAELSPADLRLISALTASSARPLGYEVRQLDLVTRSAIRLRQLPRDALRCIRTWIGRALRAISPRWMARSVVDLAAEERARH